MKLIVLGATGGTGLQIVQQAIRRGHAVTAFVRSPERLGEASTSTLIGGTRAFLLGQQAALGYAQNMMSI